MVLQGVVDSSGDPSVEILGITVSAGGGTTFEDANVNVITSLLLCRFCTGPDRLSNGPRVASWW